MGDAERVSLRIDSTAKHKGDEVAGVVAQESCREVSLSCKVPNYSRPFFFIFCKCDIRGCTRQLQPNYVLYIMFKIL